MHVCVSYDENMAVFQDVRLLTRWPLCLCLIRFPEHDALLVLWMVGKFGSSLDGAAVIVAPLVTRRDCAIE